MDISSEKLGVSYLEQRYVGVLVNQRLYNGIEKGKTGHEALYQYVLAGNQYQVTPCFFRLRDIRPGQKTIKAYIFSGGSYVRKQLPTPLVVHNRGMYQRKEPYRKLERLVQGGTLVFNQYTRYSKSRIHRILLLNPEIRVSLPETEPATRQSINEMMTRHHTLILKPNSGSIGKGIMKLERTDSGNWSLYYRGDQRGNYRKSEFRKQLPIVLIRAIHKKPYLVQQRLPLAEFEGRPFDFRISVQKDYSGEWNVTGIVGKAAANRSFITNVAQGGKVYPLETIVRTIPQHLIANVRERLEGFSLLVANHLSQHLPNLADIGLDVGITQDGFPMFIECNCRDLRYSFLKGGLLKEWVNTYRNPIGYASYLYEQRNNE
jgi:hypothetical protein